MEIPPFVDVFPVGKGGFPASYVSLPEGFNVAGVPDASFTPETKPSSWKSVPKASQ